MPTFYLDPVNGNDSADGSTFSLAGLPTVGPWKTWTLGATAARIAPGDTIKIAKSPDQANSGINATFTHGGATVTLASALTKDICACETDWAPSDNVTRTTQPNGRTEGSNCQKLVFAAGFTTGKAAYYDLGSDIDFSAYQKISFTIASSIDIAAGVFAMVLCSDASGDVAVDSFTINVPIGFESMAGYYHTAITLDKGSALGTYRSVALYALSDPGTATIYFDNILACNGLSLNSLIGKSGECVYPIQSISGDTTLKLGVIGYRDGALYDFSYAGSSGLAGFYYRNPITAPTIGIATNTTCEQVTDNGTVGNVITFSGGWNTSSGLQDGMTIYDGLNGMGRGIYLSKDYIKIDHIGYVRAYTNFYIAGSDYVEYSSIMGIGATGSGLYIDNACTMGHVLSGTCYFMCCFMNNSVPVSIGIDNSDDLAGLVSTATLYIQGHRETPILQVCGKNHRFEGDIYLGTYGNSASNTALFLRSCFSTYFKKIIISGTHNLIDTIFDNGADNFIEQLVLDDNIHSLIYTPCCVNCRIGFLNTNGVNITNISTFANIPSKYNIYHGYSIDIYDQSNRWFTGRPGGYISDQITGGQVAAWAYGGAETCLYFNPTSTTILLPYVFYAPITAGITYSLHFQVKKTSSAANCTLEIDRISGCGITEIKDESVTLTDSWAEHISASFTPTLSGFVRIELQVLDGSTTGDIGIDDIHLATV